MGRRGGGVCLRRPVSVARRLRIRSVAVPSRALRWSRRASSAWRAKLEHHHLSGDRSSSTASRPDGGHSVLALRLRDGIVVRRPERRLASVVQPWSSDVTQPPVALPVVSRCDIPTTASRSRPAETESPQTLGEIVLASGDGCGSLGIERYLFRIWGTEGLDERGSGWSRTRCSP